MERETLRKVLRERRRSLSKEEQKQAAMGALKVLQTLAEFHNARHIALYLANDGEISPEFITETLWQQGKCCYLPVLDPQDTTAMHFQLYTAESVLIPNRFRIPEPPLDLSTSIAAKKLDLVLMPLTGFDALGGRLGMGGGFYDRAFAFVRPDSKPLLLGLAHECQKVEKVPVQAWDVALSGVVTGDRFY